MKLEHVFNSYQSSKLVQTLKQLGSIESKSDHHRFGERLGEFIYLSDSFGLADAQAKILKARAKPLEVNNEHTLDQIIRLRQVLDKRLYNAVSENAPSYLCAPGINGSQTQEELDDFASWRKFYVAGQREMSVTIGKCRSLAHALLLQSSDKLAQLAMLDQAMLKVLDAPINRALARIPSFLQVYFDSAISAFKRENKAGLVWATAQEGKYLREMHRVFLGVMLAESELRFETVLGLLKALEKEENVIV